MKADNHKPPTHSENLQHLFQQVLQITQLSIYKDSYGLKCTGCRMLAYFPGRVSLRNNFCQLTCAEYRLFLTSLYQGRSHAPGEALLTILPEHIGYILLIG